jgi:hypothetical protein
VVRLQQLRRDRHASVTIQLRPGPLPPYTALSIYVHGMRRRSKGKKMSKSYFKGSLLATTVIAGVAFANPAHAQDATATATQDATAAQPMTPPTNVQGTGVRPLPVSRPPTLAPSRAKPLDRPKPIARPRSSSPAP